MDDHRGWDAQRSRWPWPLVRKTRRRWGVLAVGVALGAVGMMLAGLSLLGWNTLVHGPAGLVLSGWETPLHATATDSSDTMAVATGPVDEDVEGFYVLDFVTGDLQCTVLSQRTGKFAGLFKANVLRDLNIEQSKKPRFLLVTGMVGFARGPGASRPAASIAYVIDTNTGRFGAYGVQWRRDAAAIGRPQAGTLSLLDIGAARSIPIRD